MNVHREGMEWLVKILDLGKHVYRIQDVHWESKENAQVGFWGAKTKDKKKSEEMPLAIYLWVDGCYYYAYSHQYACT